MLPSSLFMHAQICDMGRYRVSGNWPVTSDSLVAVSLIVPCAGETGGGACKGMMMMMMMIYCKLSYIKNNGQNCNNLGGGHPKLLQTDDLLYGPPTINE